MARKDLLFVNSKGSTTTNARNNSEVSSNSSSVSVATKAGQQQITQYLDSNPDFLEAYVGSNVDLETLEKWIIRKGRTYQKENGGN